MRKKRDDVEYFIEREDGDECVFETNNVHMGWYPHTEDELMECGLITKHMLSNVKKHNKVMSVSPGYRKDNQNKICCVEKIDPKFHQGDDIHQKGGFWQNHVNSVYST